MFHMFETTKKTKKFSAKLRRQTRNEKQLRRDKKKKHDITRKLDGGSRFYQPILNWNPNNNLDIWTWRSIPWHTQKVKVKGHSVQTLERTQRQKTDGRDCITSRANAVCNNI